MTKLEPIFLFGAGGHGRAVNEVIRRQGKYEVACVLDDDPDVRPVSLPPVSGGREFLSSLPERGIQRGFVTVGNNADRELLTTLIEGAELTLVTAVDPSAIVAHDAEVGAGSVLMPMSFVGAAARVGRGAIVNTSATVDHDCVVEDFAHLSAGVHMTGQCVVGARSFVGIGAVLGGTIHIGERAVIGAGAAVVSDVDSGVVAAGVPARPLSSSP